ncbi:MAG: alpha-amylase [Deltaproteobacteria bacterium]|nr:alpha-amylase [Deltaproteobacteria bacterium]
MRDVILHAFDWRYNDITENAEKISKAGYGAVLIPPPLYSLSDESGKEWWQRYQPKDYRILRSFLGDKAGLEKAIAALHDKEVRVYADIVFNHMANENRPDRYSFPGEAELRRYRQERETFERDRLYGTLDDGLFSPWDFNRDGNIQDWMDLHEATEHSLSGLPDLDINQWVIDQQRECLRALNGMGFDGYRIDAVKHLPEDHILRVFETVDMGGKFLFGEALTSNDSEERVFLWPLFRDTDLSFYDFPLHETLRRTFSPSGSMRELVDPAAFGQALPSFRAVTFGVTHDMPNNEGFRGVMLQHQDEYLANVYLMGRDGGVPLVYSDNNQSAGRYPEDCNRWADSWMREDIAAMIRFHNAVHGMPQRPLFEHDSFLVFARGDRGIVAINKSGQWQHPCIWTWGLRNGVYRCQIHGHEMQVSGECFSFAIPPRQAQMWLYAES